jgi:hypothetical protein
MTAPSLTTLAARLAATEARLADIEGGYGRTIYRLERSAVRLELNLGTVMEQLGVTAATEDEVDAVLDAG